MTLRTDGRSSVGLMQVSYDMYCSPAPITKIPSLDLNAVEVVNSWQSYREQRHHRPPAKNETPLVRNCEWWKHLLAVLRVLQQRGMKGSKSAELHM